MKRNRTKAILMLIVMIFAVTIGSFPVAGVQAAADDSGTAPSAIGIHRPVPTEFERSNALDDLIFYPSAGDPEEILASLPQGDVVVTDADMFNATVMGPEYGTVETVDVAGQNFPQAIRATVTTVPAKPYNFQLDFKGILKDKVQEGDIMLLKISMRTVAGGVTESQSGQIQCVVAQTSGVYEKILQGNVVSDNKWTTAYFPVKYISGYDGITIRLGYYLQTVEFGGLEVINFHDYVELKDLPSASSLPPSFDEDAEWRAEALDRIEQIRKGDINVIVKDAEGNVVPDADVGVNMYEHEFQFGSCVEDGRLFNDQQYIAAIPKYFNSAVLENNFKWNVYESNPELTWSMVNTLKSLGVKYIRGTTLVWDRVRNENDSTVPADLPGLYNDREALDNRIREHISGEAGAFAGELVDWDVLNEASVNHVMIDIQGRDIINSWYDWARQADPYARLYYNDAFFDQPTFDLLDWMTANNVDFDGIGIESHYDVAQDPVELDALYDRLDQYGKRLKITEFDANIADPYLQATFTRDFMINLFSHESIDGFYMWGFKNWPNSKRCVFYDSNGAELPALKQYEDLVYNKWWTREIGKTDAEGKYSVRGFYGDYDITATANGISKTVSAEFHKGNDNTIVITLDGTAVPDGKADLSGNSTAAVGGLYELTYGLTGAANVAGQDVTISFDPDMYELVSGEPVAANTVIAESDTTTPGSIRYILATTGQGNALNGANVPVLKLTFNVKAGAEASEIAITSAKLTNGSGVVTESELDSITVKVTDRTSLAAAIQAAETLKGSAEEGTHDGQYIAGAKEGLESAITAAMAVLNNPEATNEQTADAVEALNAAVSYFQSFIITSTTGDLNGSGGCEIGDIGIVAQNYGSKAGDAGWDYISQYDINKDGEIGLYELTFIAGRILGK